VEVVLLFPWALVYKEYGIFGFLAGIIFLVVLGIGMAYEWRKGDLDWARPNPKAPKLDDMLKKVEVKKD
jgi:NADH-quinone oxidoreductase subunit A